MKCEKTAKLLGILATIAAAGAWSCPTRAEMVGFEDVGAGLGTDGYWNGSDSSGGFTSGSLEFSNKYDSKDHYWSGWAYSNTTDTTTPDYTNQYSAFTGGGVGGSATYGVGYSGFGGDVRITVPANHFITTAMITNTTYAAKVMLDGNAYATKFGAPPGIVEDWFLLTILGTTSTGHEVGSVEFYLADYRFADDGLDYVVDDWTEVDLSSLKGATTLEFSLTSSDVGTWGMNTPAYFAMDNIVLEQVPEPSTIVMLISATAVLLLARRRR